MKKTYFFFLFLAVGALAISPIAAQTIWDGPTVEFSKAPNADFTDPANQDRLTDDIWLTRGNTMGLYNIAVESLYEDFVSPVGTEWAFGTTTDLANLTFDSWENTNGSNPPSTVGVDMVLHLVNDNIYIDIQFTQWGQGGAGGGSFAYQRSSEPSVNTDDISEREALKLFPNPASDFVQIAGLKRSQEYTIVNLTGQIVLGGVIHPNASIDVSGLVPGVYFLQLGSAYSLRLVRK